MFAQLFSTCARVNVTRLAACSNGVSPAATVSRQSSVPVVPSISLSMTMSWMSFASGPMPRASPSSVGSAGNSRSITRLRGRSNLPALPGTPGAAVLAGRAAFAETWSLSPRTAGDVLDVIVQRDVACGAVRAALASALDGATPAAGRLANALIWPDVAGAARRAIWTTDRHVVREHATVCALLAGIVAGVAANTVAAFLADLAARRAIAAAIRISG